VKRLSAFFSVLNETKATLPHISSPLVRSASLPQDHPHSRKRSVLDGQVQLHDLPTSERMPPIYATNSSAPKLSLSLGPIREGSASPVSPGTTAVPSPANTFPEQSSYVSGQHADKLSAPLDNTPRSREPVRRPPQLDVGNGVALNGRNPPSRKPSSFPVPNSELILYSYAQLVGTVTLLPSDTPLSMEQSRNLYTLRRELETTKPVGGGSMNIAPNSPKAFAHGAAVTDGTARRPPHARSVSLSSGLLSLLSPSAILSSPSSPPPVPSQPRRVSAGHSRSPSVFNGFFATSSSTSSDIDSTGSGPGDDYGDPSEPLPTFDVPPSMLAIDLTLGPGQSRSCAYAEDVLRSVS
jgi:RAB6A-GEF complex partner protein 2